MTNSTPCSRAFIENLQGPQPVKEYPTFYETRRFITEFKRVHHLPYDEADQYSPCTHPTSRTPILILSSHLSLDLPSKLFPSSFSTETPYAPPLSPITCYMPSLCHYSWFDYTNNILWWVRIIKFLGMHSFLHSSVTSSLLDPNIFLSTIFSNTLRVYSSLNVVQSFTPIQITSNLIVFIRLIMMKTK